MLSARQSALTTLKTILHESRYGGPLNVHIESICSCSIMRATWMWRCLISITDRRNSDIADLLIIPTVGILSFCHICSSALDDNRHFPTLISSSERFESLPADHAFSSWRNRSQVEHCDSCERTWSLSRFGIKMRLGFGLEVRFAAAVHCTEARGTPPDVHVRF